ncbi:mitochondrial inner membrane protein COX18-like [Copidosoma floridanum]|uniref:mitochondrial inner membrane protein COX18-like n=1 Tax=Copidosoma floridanum TaxID=29053 RepID=UPI0006C9CBEB|nr:mitochondrial inner membrane protein COX18-like [Copidosoma floridanum]
MNLQIFNKFLRRSVQHSRSLLILQHNVIRCGAAHYTVNFHHKYKNDSSYTLFSKQLRRKDLRVEPAVPLYMDFQKRYISNEDIVINIPKNKQNRAPMESTDPVKPDFAGILEKDESIITDAFECPEFLVEFAQSKSVVFVQDILVLLHQEMGLPWWATIILSTILIRTTLILPLAVNQMRNKAKLQRMENDMNDYKKKLKTEYKEYKRHYGWPDELFAQKYTYHVNLKEKELYKKNKIHPNKVHFLVMAEAGIWLYTSLAIRNLCHALPLSDGAQEIYREMSFDGFGWITDLTVVDPYSILPFFVCFTNIFIIQAHRLFHPNCYSFKMGITYITCQFGNMLMVPMMVSAPAAINIYWLTHSLYGLLEVYLLHSPFVLRLLRTPPLDSKEPYRFFYKLWKSNIKEAE